MLRIPVDFNVMNKDGTYVYVPQRISIELGARLEKNQKVILYEEHEMEVEAILGTNVDTVGRVWWYGVADWSTLVYY